MSFFHIQLFFLCINIALSVVNYSIGIPNTIIIPALPDYSNTVTELQNPTNSTNSSIFDPFTESFQMITAATELLFDVFTAGFIIDMINVFAGDYLPPIFVNGLQTIVFFFLIAQLVMWRIGKPFVR